MSYFATKLPFLAVIVFIPSMTMAVETLRSDYPVIYHGKVVDDLQRPIANAKVALIGTTLSVTTGADGSFKIKGKARNDIAAGATPDVPAIGASPERFCPLAPMVTSRGRRSRMPRA